MKKILTLLSLLAIVFAAHAQNGDISGKVKDWPSAINLTDPSCGTSCGPVLHAEMTMTTIPNIMYLTQFLIRTPLFPFDGRTSTG